MPIRKKHNQGVLNDIPFATNSDVREVDNTNKWMDEPSQRYPGMKHRNHRHNPINVGRRLSGGSDSSYWKKFAIAQSHATMDDTEHGLKVMFPKRKSKR